jgi:hypothetical protein
LDVLDDVHDVDAGAFLAVRMGAEMAFVVDPKISRPPILDIVELNCFFDGPIFDSHNSQKAKNVGSLASLGRFVEA